MLMRSLKMSQTLFSPIFANHDTKMPSQKLPFLRRSWRKWTACHPSNRPSRPVLRTFHRNLPPNKIATSLQLARFPLKFHRSLPPNKIATSLQLARFPLKFHRNLPRNKIATSLRLARFPLKFHRNLPRNKIATSLRLARFPVPFRR